MLAGVGGATIDEAKSNISYREYLIWLEYRETHGSLDVRRRMDRSAAVLATVVNRSAGGSAKVTDFLPKEAEAELTPDSVMAMLSKIGRS